MASFICQNCKETHGSELDDEEYLDDEQSISDDEELIDDVLDNDHEEDKSSRLIINEQQAKQQQQQQQQQQPQQQQQQTKVKVEKLNDTNNLVLDNQLNNSNELVNQKQTPPSTKRKANDSYSSNKQIVQTMNGSLKAIRKTTTKQQPQKQVEKEDENELFCVCRTPYNESQFYIQCENCNEWLHGMLLISFFLIPLISFQ